jgi:hypothetical protein
MVISEMEGGHEREIGGAFGDSCFNYMLTEAV